eukprot:403362987
MKYIPKIQLQILVLILSYWTSVNSTCLKYAFPHTLGGFDDATKIYGMDMLNDDIVIAGIVHDSSIASPGAKFSKEGDKVIAVNDRGLFWYVIFNAQTGVVIKQRQHRTNQINPKSITLSDFYFSSQVEIFALTSPDSQFILLTFYGNAYNILQSNINYGFAASLAQSSNENSFYVGGLQQNEASLSIVDLRATLIKNYKVQTNISPTNDVVISTLLVEKDSTQMKDRVYGTILIDQNNYPYLDIFDLLFDMNSQSLISSKTLNPDPYKFIVCHYIWLLGPNLTGLILEDSNYKLFYVYLDMNTLQATIFNVILFNQQTYTIMTASYSIKYGPLIGGYTNAFASSTAYPAASFNQQVGCINTFQDTKRCNGQPPVNQAVQFQASQNTCSLLTFDYGSSSIDLNFKDPQTASSSFIKLDSIFFNCSQVVNYEIQDIANISETYIFGSLYQANRQSFSINCIEAQITYSVTVPDTALTYNSQTNMITFQTNDITLNYGIVVITIQGFVKQSWQFKTYTITLAIFQDPCDSVQITTEKLNDVVYDISYGSGYFLNNLNWIQSASQTGTCDPYTLNITAYNVIDGGIIGGWYYIKSNQLMSNSTTFIGRYRVVVQALLKNSTTGGDIIKEKDLNFTFKKWEILI